MASSLLQPLGVLVLAGAGLLAGCDRRDDRPQTGSDSTTTASTAGRDAANTTGAAGTTPGTGAESGAGTTAAGTGSAGTGPADSTVSGTGMGGGNPNGQGTGDSSTRSNVPAGALPASGATRDNEGLNRGQTNSR